jgi:N-acyl-D-aspartate/D-glutamate deacylase
MTDVPAARMKLEDRGRIAPGMIADLVLFDPATIADRATFQEPFVLPTGMKGVWVGGIRVWDGSTTTGAHPGRSIR